MTDQLRQAAQQALEALETLSKLGNGNSDGNSIGNTIAQEAREHLFTALAQPEQEPVAWNVIDPAGNILATEKNAIRGWARVNGYKPTVEGLLGLHELGWRVLPTSPPAAQRPWQGLTPEEVKRLYPYGRSVLLRETCEAIEKALKDKNT